MSECRPVVKKKLTQGTAVSYTPGRFWFQAGHGYVEAPKEFWGKPCLGVVVPDEKHRGGHRSPDHAWGVRLTETVVEFETPQASGHRIEKIPTALLDRIEGRSIEKQSGQALFAF